MLPALDLYEDFIDVESVAVAEIESIAEPAGIRNGVWPESVTIVGIHH
jgi:hypothetical protein